MERVTRRIKESSESRGRRPFDDDEEDDDDAFLSGNMAGSSGKRKSKSHPCVVRLPVEPDRRSPVSSSHEYFYACVSANRGDPRNDARTGPADKNRRKTE